MINKNENGCKCTGFILYGNWGSEGCCVCLTTLSWKYAALACQHSNPSELGGGTEQVNNFLIKSGVYAEV